MVARRSRWSKAAARASSAWPARSSAFARTTRCCGSWSAVERSIDAVVRSCPGGSRARGFDRRCGRHQPAAVGNGTHARASKWPWLARLRLATRWSWSCEAIASACGAAKRRASKSARSETTPPYDLARPLRTVRVMTPITQRSPVAVALVGNPNTGKTTLFTALAGVRQRVGNYPGVTVEKKIGLVGAGRRRAASWSTCRAHTAWPRARRTRWWPSTCCWAGNRACGPIDACLSIVDASNLERNLYLVSQVLELGLPTVVALNMVDIARAKGLKIDVERLRSAAGRAGGRGAGQPADRRGRAASGAGGGRVGPDAAGQARKPVSRGVSARGRCAAIAALVAAANGTAQAGEAPLDALLGRAAAARHERLLAIDTGRRPPRRALAAELAAARARLAAAGCQVPAVEAHARYAWVARVLEGVVTRPAERDRARAATGSTGC